MKYYKPKDMAKFLDLPPEKISKLANDIETTSLHKFRKTPMGSYLFIKSDLEVLKEYHQILFFFKNKKQVNKMFEYRMDEISFDEGETQPTWTKHLKNAVFFN
jgi:hypothetical protein